MQVLGLRETWMSTFAGALSSGFFIGRASWCKLLGDDRERRTQAWENCVGETGNNIRGRERHTAGASHAP